MLGCLYWDIWSKRATQFAHLQKNIAQKPSHTTIQRSLTMKKYRNWKMTSELLGPSVGSADLLNPLKRKITENKEKEVKFDTVIVWNENKKKLDHFCFYFYFFARPCKFCSFIFIFIYPPRLNFFWKFPVKHLIKKNWPYRYFPRLKRCAEGMKYFNSIWTVVHL